MPTAATAAKIAMTAAISPRTARLLRGGTAQPTAQRPSEQTQRGQRGDARAREQVAVHAMVELDDVRARGNRHEELPDRVGMYGDRSPVDRRVPTRVVGLAEHDTIAVRHIDLRAPSAEPALLQVRRRSRLAHPGDVGL